MEVRNYSGNTRYSTRLSTDVSLGGATIACHDDNRRGFLGRIKEHRVVFCIDTSGSMYGCLDTVKDHLIAALEYHAGEGCEGDQFNVIEFSTDLVKWAAEMVDWTEQTVAVASKWIRELNPKTGTNTRDALVTAFSDPNCDAVYLITDSLPDQRVSDVIDAALRAAGSRPVHCFYIQTGEGDQRAVSFLEELAKETYGSFYKVIISQSGLFERVTNVYCAEGGPDGIVRTTSGGIFLSGHKMCSVGTTVDGPVPVPISSAALVVPPWPYHLYPWPYRYYYSLIAPCDREWTRFRPAKAWLKHAQDFVNGLTKIPVPGAASMLVGARVLVRRQRDGLFYNGVVKSEVR
jgi:von Willebrand factor type A domain